MCGPEHLELFVDQNVLASLTIRQIKTPWGTDDTRYCLVDDAIIGAFRELPQEMCGYYNRLGIDCSRCTRLVLTPMLDTNQYIKLPGVSEFENSITKFFTSTSGWSLVCIGDPDEIPEVYFNNTETELRNLADKIFECFRGGGVFPTLVIHSN